MRTFKTLLAIFFIGIGFGLTAAPASAQRAGSCMGPTQNSATGLFDNYEKLTQLPAQECVTQQHEIRCTTEVVTTPEGKYGLVHPEWINAPACQRAMMVNRGPQGFGGQLRGPTLGERVVGQALGAFIQGEAIAAQKRLDNKIWKDRYETSHPDPVICRGPNGSTYRCG